MSNVLFFKNLFLSSNTQLVFSSINRYNCSSAQYFQFCAFVIEIILQILSYLLHKALETLPCNCDTPFANLANRKAANEWLNISSGLPVSFFTSSIVSPQK